MVSDVDEAVDAVFATVGEPVRHSSLFYALLYAVDVAGVDEAAFDFAQVRNHSADGFFWYGIGSITKELAHLGDRYFIDGQAASNMAPDDYEIIQHIQQDLFPGDRSQQFVARELWRVVPALWQLERPEEMDSVFATLDDEFDVIENPMQYVRNVKRMFEATPNVDKGPQSMSGADNTGWPIGYNGPSWVGICDHLLRRDSLGPTAWVDQSWAIEHNNNRWIDVIDFFMDPQQVAAIQDVTGIDVDDLGANIDRADVFRAVVDVLDAAREGNISRLFDYAVYFDEDVGVDLRRLRIELGV